MKPANRYDTRLKRRAAVIVYGVFLLIPLLAILTWIGLLSAASEARVVTRAIKETWNQ